MGTLLQLVFAVIILRTPPGRAFFSGLTNAVTKLLDFSDASLDDVGVWPGEESIEEVTAETREAATVPALEESAFWGNGGARDFDWGD